MKFIYCFLLLIELILTLFTGGLAFLILFILTLLSPFTHLVLISIVNKKFTVSFDMPKRIKKNQIANCKLVLKNGNRLFYPNIKTKLTIKNPVTNEQSVLIFSNSVMPNGKLENTFNFESSFCGTVSILVESIKIYDLFGIVFRTLECKTQDYLTVLPEINIADYLSESEKFNQNNEFETQKNGKDLYNISHLREYQKGDNLNQIHHKLSAKYDELIVKQGSENEDKKTKIVFDNFVEKPLSAPLANQKVEDFLSKCFSLIKTNAKLEIVAFIYGKITSFEIECEDDFYSVVAEFLKIEFIVGKSVF